MKVRLNYFSEVKFSLFIYFLQILEIVQPTVKSGTEIARKGRPTARRIAKLQYVICGSYGFSKSVSGNKATAGTIVPKIPANEKSVLHMKGQGF